MPQNDYILTQFNIGFDCLTPKSKYFMIRLKRPVSVIHIFFSILASIYICRLASYEKIVRKEKVF